MLSAVQFQQLVIDAHHYSRQHQDILQASQACGCFSCLARFRFDHIEDWLTEEGTALCPYCGLDTVIGDACGYPVDSMFLYAMQRYWMGDFSLHFSA